MNKFKSVGLARMVLDGRHVQNFSYSLDDATIVAKLSTAGISAKLYGGKREGRVLDLARQLVRMRTDAYLFWVSAETIGPIYVVAKELKRLRPDAIILFWGNIIGSNPSILYNINNVGEVLPCICINTIVSFFMDSVSCEDNVFSPYSIGLLAHSEMPRLGLDGTQPLAGFLADLTILNGANFNSETIIPVHAAASSSMQLIELAEVIQKSETLAKFELHINSVALSEEFLQAVPSNKFTRIVVNGSHDDMELFMSRSDVSIIPYGDYQKDQRAAIYGANGSVALHAGFYFDAKQSAGIYHLEIPISMPPEDRANVYEWAATSMDIRSAAVLTGSLEELTEHAERFAAPLSLETGGWPKHTYTLERSVTGKGSITFDSNSNTIQKINYVAFENLHLPMSPSADSITYVSIKTSRDADELERRLQRFHSSGDIVINHPHTPQLIENSCRWMEYGACRLPLVRRLAVDTSMRLSSCRDTGDVGKVGDDFDQIVIRVKQQAQLEEIRRECSTCEIRDKCSHCSMLPNEWGGRYCSLRRSYQHTSLYLEMHKFVQAFLKTGPQVEMDMIALSVSYTGLPPKYYKGKAGIARDGQRPIIIRILDQDIVFWRGTQKIRRLSAPLVTMAEAWWMGAEQVDIIEALMHDFSVKREMAISSLELGMKKLKDEGIIYG